MGSGGGGTQTTTQSNTPWGPAQPGLIGQYGAGQDWFFGPQGNQYANPTAPGAPSTGGFSGPNPGVMPFSGQASMAPNIPGTEGYQPSPNQMPFGSAEGDTGNSSGGGWGLQGGGQNQNFTPQQPAYNPSYGDRTGWMNQPTVAPTPLATQAAWDKTTQMALNNPMTQSATGLAQNIMQGGQFGQNPAMQGYGNIAQQSPWQNPAMRQLQQTASGQMLNNNPYMNQMYGNAAQQMGNQFNNITMPGLASRYSAAGRTGSGAETMAYGQAQNQLGQGLASLGTNIFGNNYANERGLQQQAQGQLGNFYNSGIANQLAGLGGLGTGYENDASRQMQALGMAPQVSNMGYGDISQLLGVGQMQQAQTQNQMNAPLTRLQQFQGLNNPMGFGTQTSQQPLYGGGMSGLGSLAGMGLGYALAPATGGMSAALPYMMMGGMAGGTAGGMFER